MTSRAFAWQCFVEHRREIEEVCQRAEACLHRGLSYDREYLEVRLNKLVGEAHEWGAKAVERSLRGKLRQP